VGGVSCLQLRACRLRATVVRTASRVTGGAHEAAGREAPRRDVPAKAPVHPPDGYPARPRR